MKATDKEVPPLVGENVHAGESHADMDVNRLYQRGQQGRAQSGESVRKPHDCGVLTGRTKPAKVPVRIEWCMSTSATAVNLSDKQRRILQYLRERGETKTYFKSRLIGKDLGLSAKEVGTNMTAIENGEFDIHVEKWGYSSSTTWKVTV